MFKTENNMLRITTMNSIPVFLFVINPLIVTGLSVPNSKEGFIFSNQFDTLLFWKIKSNSKNTSLSN